MFECSSHQDYTPAAFDMQQFGGGEDVRNGDDFDFDCGTQACRCWGWIGMMMLKCGIDEVERDKHWTVRGRPVTFIQ